MRFATAFPKRAGAPFTVTPPHSRRAQRLCALTLLLVSASSFSYAGEQLYETDKYIVTTPLTGLAIVDNVRELHVKSTGAVGVFDADNIANGDIRTYDEESIDMASAGGKLYHTSGSLVTETDTEGNQTKLYGLNGQHLGAVSIAGVTHLVGIDNNGDYRVLNTQTDEIVKTGNNGDGADGGDVYMAVYEDGTQSTSLDDLIIVTNGSGSMRYSKNNTLLTNFSHSVTIGGDMTDVAVNPVEGTTQMEVYACTNFGGYVGTVARMELQGGGNPTMYVIPDVQFDAPAISVREEEGTIEIPFSLSRPTQLETIVEASVTGGTADSGDYTGLTRATVPPGEQAGSLALTLLDDDAYEPGETVELALAADEARVQGQTQMTVHIADNDPEPAPPLPLTPWTALATALALGLCAAAAARKRGI